MTKFTIVRNLCVFVMNTKIALITVHSDMKLIAVY